MSLILSTAEDVQYAVKSDLSTAESYCQYNCRYAVIKRLRLKRPETKRFYGKVSSVLAQSEKVLNFKKFLICVLLKS